MAKKPKTETDPSTEEKIKEAARLVFTRKGYADTRTRDIAEEAGINLALLNYYFRSKEKLFDIIMMENLQQFLMGMKGVLNNEASSLTDKVSAIAANYINLLKAQPDLPLFILTEIRTHPQKLAAMGIKDLLLRSHFYRQLQATTRQPVNPLHFIINIIGLTVSPFIAGPMLQVIGDLNHLDFDRLMDERKSMIPAWVEAMLAAN